LGLPWGVLPARFFNGFPKWEEADAFWSALFALPTADVPMGSVAKFTAAPSLGTYTLATYEVQVPSIGGNTVAGTVVPSTPATLASTAGAGLTAGSWYIYGVSFVNAAGEGPLGPQSSILTPPAASLQVTLTNIPTGPAGTTARNIYRTAAGGALLKFVATLGDNVSAVYVDNMADVALGGPLGTITAPAGSQIGPDVDLDNSLIGIIKMLEFLNPFAGTGVKVGTFAELTLVPNTTFCQAIAGYPRFETRPWVGGLAPVPTAPAATTTPVATGPAAPTLTLQAGVGLNAGDYYYAVSFVTAAEGWAGPTAKITTVPGNQQVRLTGIAIGATGTLSRKIYRTPVGGGALQLVTTIADNTTTTYLDATADGALGAQPPLGAVAPTLKLAGGAGLGIGAYTYAVSLVPAAGGQGPLGVRLPSRPPVATSRST